MTAARQTTRSKTSPSNGISEHLGYHPDQVHAYYEGQESKSDIEENGGRSEAYWNPVSIVGLALQKACAHANRLCVPVSVPCVQQKRLAANGCNEAKRRTK